MVNLRNRKLLLILGCLLSAALVIFLLLWLSDRVHTNIQQLPVASEEEARVEPELKTSEVAAGLDHPWDIAFPSSDIIFYTQRSGQLRGRVVTSGEDWQLVVPPSIGAFGEGGLLGLTLDSDFVNNKLLYICYNFQTPTERSVRVLRYKTSADLRSVSEEKVIISDIQSQGGRHSGCRLDMDKDGNLWVGTGDSALAAAAQDPSSLAGKVVRVNREGKAVQGNLPTPFDDRIFSYGHRNVQGLILLSEPLPNGAYGYSIEQGTGRDDEINYLLPGNFGWDPNRNGRYEENAPMTDLEKFPDAVKEVWATGDPTLALSGGEILHNKHWSAWQSRIIAAALKAKQAVLIEVDDQGKFLSKKDLFKDEYGRIRTFAEGPAGDLYLLTDNGTNDKIIRIEVSCTICN